MLNQKIIKETIIGKTSIVLLFNMFSKTYSLYINNKNFSKLISIEREALDFYDYICKEYQSFQKPLSFKEWKLVSKRKDDFLSSDIEINSDLGELNKSYTYKCNKVGKDTYTILRSDGKVIFSQLNCPKYGLTNFVNSYKGNNIKPLITSFINNKNLYYKDGETFNETETKYGILRYKALEKKEELLFTYAEDLVIEGSLKGKTLSLSYLRELHYEVFTSLYEWAGMFRTKSISFGQKEGIPPYQIETQLVQLFENIEYRLSLYKQNKSEDILVDILTQLEYEFVLIHPFENTNGRTARLLTYFIICRVGYKGKPNIYDSRDRREEYISALRSYDRGDRTKLLGLLKEYLKNFTIPK